ncbi:MAG: branched-chain amino acid transport system ATP-binding protein [Ilumatobacteraceae bacterium]|jgi:branched-chain amino acid transport system ATP-binding protein
MSAVLSARGITVSFGGVHAVVDVDLDVEPGQLVGLIGPNGAGKTTFIDAVTGFVQHGGSVELAGTDISALPPHARARRGLARTWQSIELFDDLSVRENLTVAAHQPSVLTTVKELFARPVTRDRAVDEALDMFALGDLAEATPTELTQGQRKLVAVARALAARPKLLCLDEPAAGLDAQESVVFGRHLREIVDRGTPILLVDHDMGLVLGISDRVVVLEFGREIANGTPSAVREDPKVVTAYLGSATTETVTTAPVGSSAPISIDDLREADDGS